MPIETDMASLLIDLQLPWLYFIRRSKLIFNMEDLFKNKFLYCLNPT